MRNFLYIAFLFLLISGCKPGVPKELIQPVVMAKVLSDIHVVDSYVGGIPSIDSAKAVAAAFYNGIYKKYDIDSAKYAQSMDYYNKNPKVLDDIYTSVVADLSKQREVIVKSDSIFYAKRAANEALKMKTDSLLKADPNYKIRFLLKDTTTHKLDIIKPNMVYKTQ